MKFMGSKRMMLQNGLGSLILQEAQNADRFVDLFCGSASVSWFAAQNTALPVFATDLQLFSTILANSVVSRVEAIDSQILINEWLLVAAQERAASPLWHLAMELDAGGLDIRTRVNQARTLCDLPSTIGPVWNAYGGHYFSPTQSLTFDYLIAMLPNNDGMRSVGMTAILRSASKCAASPGHTAQPFQPTETAGRFIEISWAMDPIELCRRELEEICPIHANFVGNATIADALEIAEDLHENDLVFVDPPYSDVQYSRFYHVLETIARMEPVEVDGIGRYPNINQRPQSGFSRRGESETALRVLLTGLHNSGCTVIFTFPVGLSSNGLAGNRVIEIATEFFEVDEFPVNGRFSTLGGNNNRRLSRMESRELILTLRPF